MATRRARVASIVAIAFMLLGGLAIVGEANATSRHAVSPTAPTLRSETARSVALELLSALRGAPPSLWAKLASLTPSQIATFLQTTPWRGADPALIHASFIEAANFVTEVSLTGYFGGFLTGCVMGAGLGAIGGGPVGAGAGCVVGGAAVDIGLYWFGNQAAASQLAVEKQFQADEAAAFYNMEQEYQGLVTLGTSELNSTFPAFAAMADNAALQQIGNSTFNSAQDMNSSGVPFQMATLFTDYSNAISGGLYALNAAETNGYGPSGTFSSGGAYKLLTLGATSGSVGPWGHDSGGNEFYSRAQGEVDTSINLNGAVELNTGSNVIFSCGTSATLTSAPSNPANPTISHSTLTVPANGTLYYTATYASVWTLTLGGPCEIEGNSEVGVPIAAASPTTVVSIVACGAMVTTPCHIYAHNAWKATGALQFCEATSSSASCNVGPTYTVGLGATNGVSAIFNNLMLTAQTNAKAYWTYLRFLGYTSVSQIPSTCIIPMPSNILPPQFDQGLGVLTLNQSLALYSAWMAGLAVFFNSPSGQFNATTVCHGHPTYAVQNTLWNLNVITTGYVYTLPVAHQNFGVKSTWTVTNASTNNSQVGNQTNVGNRADPTPIVIWPTVKTLYAHVGSVQEVPTDDPLFVFVPKNGTLYELYGNGTAAGSTGFSNGTVSSTAGAALFISTCKIRNLATNSYDNAPSAYCPLMLATIATVVFNTTAPPVFSIGGCETGNAFLDSFVAFWNTLLFGIGGCTLADFLALITIVIVIVIVLYVIVWIARAIGGARRRSSEE